MLSVIYLFFKFQLQVATGVTVVTAVTVVTIVAIAFSKDSFYSFWIT